MSHIAVCLNGGWHQTLVILLFSIMPDIVCLTANLVPPKAQSWIKLINLEFEAEPETGGAILSQHAAS